jgi:glyceraldehyde 3-phosphate dehydrogenase
VTVRLGINGFGRIGRLAFRAGYGRPDVTFVQINEVAGGPAAAAHLLAFDTTHGYFDHAVTADDDSIAINGTPIVTTAHATPEDADWRARGVDIVLECTGRFTTPAQLEGHFAAGAKRIVVAAPVHGGGALNVVMGVNDERYDAASHPIVTAASCTTNALAPIVKVVHEALGIRHGSMTTLHAQTSSQSIVDRAHHDLRRARAAGANLIPTTTGSATAIGLIFPELEGKLDGHAVRVPVQHASLLDCVFEVEAETTAAEVNGILHAAAAGPLAGILGFEERPLVSSDFRGDPRSAVIDARSTMVVGRTQVKIYAWYDNEWGYANRLVELAALVGRSLDDGR